MELSNQQKRYVDAIIEHAPESNIDIAKQNFSRAELRLISMTWKGKKWIPNWITHDLSRRVGRGVFSIPEVMEHTPDVSPDDVIYDVALDDDVVDAQERMDNATMIDASDEPMAISDDVGYHVVADDMVSDTNEVEVYTETS